MADNELARVRRLLSRASVVSTSSDTDDTDFHTARVSPPVTIPLDKFSLGSAVYTSALDCSTDLELLYELDSQDILVRASVEGDEGEPPGLFRIRGVSAADLSVLCLVPGSLESMISRLILEVEQDVVFEPAFQASSDQPPDSPAPSLSSRLVKMSASVHEAGHFRDVLLFLKCENIADLNPELAQLSSLSNKPSPTATPKLTFLDFLPLWVLFIPWRLYSRNSRKVIQSLIVVYYVFSVLWAFWQLYRHVSVIQFVLEPLIETLKLYLSWFVEYFDWLFVLFTQYWHKYLSPLNVLYRLLTTPLVQVLAQIRTLVSPLVMLLYNSPLILAFKNILSFLYASGLAGWSFVSAFLVVLLRPFSGIWKALLNARVAVSTLDLQRVRLGWVVALVTGSLRSIGNGLARLAGYTSKTKKRRQALSQDSTDQCAAASPVNEHKLRQRQHMPMYYNSPLSKKS